MKILNLRYHKMLVLLAFVFLIAHTAMAATDPLADPLADHPGYVNFSALQFLSGQEAKVEVRLKSPLLSLMAGLVSAEDAQAGALVSQLQRVLVQVFDTTQHDINQISDAMALTGADLDNNGWERIVRVRDNADHVDVYFRLSDDASIIHGIAVMVVEPRETVFVNIIGDINAADITSLAQRFHIRHLQDMDACDFDPDAC